MGAGEIVVIAMLVISGIWLAAKTMGFVWRIVRAPVMGLVDRFFVITSSYEPVQEALRTGSEGGSTGSQEVVLPHQYQPEPDPEVVREPEREPATLRSLSRLEEIALLAVQRNDDGSYRHSANKIVDLMGGTAADVKSQVAAIRGPTKPLPMSPGSPMKRPANGWQ